jgi:hypothetical protein
MSSPFAISLPASEDPSGVLMQQRQLRLGDILDDYCPRERRLTNHAVVAMIGDDVKQTRCTTCDTEHEYKHAKVPRQRRKPESPAALIAQAAVTPKRVPHEQDNPQDSLEPRTSEDPAEMANAVEETASEEPSTPVALEASSEDPDDISEAESSDDEPATEEEGPVHRPLIRATLPRVGGQPPAPPPGAGIYHSPAGRSPESLPPAAGRRRPAVFWQPFQRQPGRRPPARWMEFAAAGRRRAAAPTPARSRAQATKVIKN